MAKFLGGSLQLGVSTQLNARSKALKAKDYTSVLSSIHGNSAFINLYSSVDGSAYAAGDFKLEGGIAAAGFKAQEYLVTQEAQLANLKLRINSYDSLEDSIRDLGSLEEENRKAAINQLKEEGKIEVHTKYQLGSVSGNEKVESINIKHDDDSIKEIKTDYVLGFFGLIMKLGPIAEWGLNLDKKTIPVNTENFETNKEGIFAIGDICSYPGKLKLILSGFHEGALAARGCFKYAKPDEKYRFEFTTSSKTVKGRLGVKE